MCVSPLTVAAVKGRLDVCTSFGGEAVGIFKICIPAKLAATANRAATDIHSTSTAPCSSSTTHDPAAALREAALREHLLQRQLKSAQLRVKAERQRSRRELKLAVARGQQAARRATKAAARKRKAARAAAARAMANRAVKRPPATGELHHSGAKKRRATLANMA